MKVDDVVYKRGLNHITTIIVKLEDVDGRRVVTDVTGKQYTKAAFVREWSLVDQSL